LAQPANTASSAKFTTLREDLEDVVYKIAPTETPCMMLVGRKGNFDQKYHEWSKIDLAAANDDNATIEGDDATNDAPNLPKRYGNYAQLMDKVAQVTSSVQASRVAGNVQKMAKQVAFKVQELKRDMEARLMTNKAAVPGDDATAGKTAGIPCFIRTNVSRGVGGANGTLSGGTTGYPNAAATPGTARPFTEDLLKPVIQAAWQNGGSPSHLIVGGFNKVQVSGFTGNATRTKKAEDKKLVAAIAVYESDFGQLQIVPSRLSVQSQAVLLDPEYAEIGWLQKMHNFALAKTGHSDRRAVACEWGVVVGAEDAHGLVADLTTA
jgi:Family of unknown function (DUF5309)